MENYGVFDILFLVEQHLKALPEFHNSVYVSIYGDTEVAETSQNHGSILIIPLGELVEPGPKGCKDKVKLRFAVAVSVYHADDHSRLASALQEVGVLGNTVIQRMRELTAYPPGVQELARQSSLSIEGMNGWVLYPLVYEARMLL